MPKAMPSSINLLGGLTRSTSDMMAVNTGDNANMIAARPEPILGMRKNVRPLGMT